MVLASCLRRHPSKMGATFTCRCRVKGSQVYGPSSTSLQLVSELKSLRPYLEQKKQTSRSNYAPKLPQGSAWGRDCAQGIPLLGFSPFPFHLQLTSFSQEPCLMKHSCRDPHLGPASGELNPRLLSSWMGSKETRSPIIVPCIRVSRTYHNLKQLHSSQFSKKHLFC